MNIYQKFNLILLITLILFFQNIPTKAQDDRVVVIYDFPENIGNNEVIILEEPIYETINNSNQRHHHRSKPKTSKPKTKVSNTKIRQSKYTPLNRQVYNPYLKRKSTTKKKTSSKSSKKTSSKTSRKKSTASSSKNKKSKCGTSIIINKRKRRLYVKRCGKYILSTSISIGGKIGKKRYATPSGRFRVGMKLASAYSNKYKAKMPYSLFFIKGLYAIHYEIGRAHV